MYFYYLKSYLSSAWKLNSYLKHKKNIYLLSSNFTHFINNKIKFFVFTWIIAKYFLRVWKNILKNKLFLHAIFKCWLIAKQKKTKPLFK